MTQLALSLDPPRARTADPDTSHAAAAQQTPERRAKGHHLVLAALHAQPLTDFELAERTGWQQTSIGKRRGELVSAGLVERTEDRRPTPSGATAIVWRITPAGIDRYHRGP